MKNSSLGQGWLVLALAVGFGGAENNTPFGGQRANSRAFVEMKYAF